jgi:2-iminobutanoate/2-iminopropanoate deaminase
MRMILMTIHHLKAVDVPKYPPIRAKWLGEQRPASMLAIVPGLVWPNILIEIEAYAVAPAE